MTETTTQSAPRPPGRPRSAHADGAIIDAVLDLLAEGTTVEALSMEAVAARAGVGKATVYRRWPHKDALLLDAVASLKHPLEEPPGRSLREDLVLLMNKAWEAHDSRAAKIMPCLIPELQREGALRTQFLEFMDRRREVMRDVLRRGMASGELRPDLEIELVLVLLSAPMLMATVGNAPKLNAEGLAERVVDAVLKGIAC
ncbi:TetR/AcrR family transcriptional regulator [Longispora albida]|uniref:TetR/AcrR family transcriptional regulator n=1 Tax=Longispora albida TaxID=203523 RepID=UPI000365DFFC|nr:TetR/AcrR family transcriptional regulator [Longispora albida]